MSKQSEYEWNQLRDYYKTIDEGEIDFDEDEIRDRERRLEEHILGI